MNYFKRLWTVDLGDFGRGLVIAVLTTPLTIIYQSVTATPMVLTFDWKIILGSAIAGGVGYLLKNIATGQNGKLLSNK